MAAPGKYDFADVIDAVRGLRVSVNTLDNIRTQLAKVRPLAEKICAPHLHVMEMEKLDSEMSKFCTWLSDVLVAIESSNEYKRVARQVRGGRNDNDG